MELGESILQCHGRDISIKTSKSKRNILVVLPVQYCFGKSTTGEVQIGSLLKTNTRSPEFIVNTPGHRHVFVGKYVAIKSKLFIMDCQVTRKQQNVLAEFYDRALVFSAQSSDPVQSLSDNTAPVVLDLTTQAGLEPSTPVQTTALSQQTPISGPKSAIPSGYITHLGCSKLADGLTSKVTGSRTTPGTGKLSSVHDSDDSPQQLSFSQSESLSGSQTQTPEPPKRVRGSSRSTVKVTSYAESPESVDSVMGGDESEEEYVGAGGHVRRRTSSTGKRKRKASQEEEEHGVDLPVAELTSPTSASERGGIGSRSRSKPPTVPRTKGARLSRRSSGPSEIVDLSDGSP